MHPPHSGDTLQPENASNTDRSAMTNDPESSITNQPPGDPSIPHRCVACGYDLRGLGEEPRCPECGLLNIPEGLRKQVWEFVDSRRWFYSGFFTPWRKRPPGWWWALDRPGDVKRSFGCLVAHVLIASALIFALSVAGNSILVETRIDYSYRWSNQPNSSWLDGGSIKMRESFRGFVGEREDNVDADRIQDYDPTTGAQTVYQTKISRRLVFDLHYGDLTSPLTWIIFALVIWAGPAVIGIWTQIRRGLPSFARAPRTIIAAANLEGHRLTYFALCGGLALGVDIVRRLALGNLPYDTDQALFVLLWGTPLFFAGAGWIGPLRSDHTRQLIRSRFHLVRILLMYAILFPLVALTAWGMLLFWIENPNMWSL